jgi:Domain of unknown function (DUF4926)
MIQELDRVVLTAALPDHHLEPGDVGTVVLIHQGGKGYEVEFVALEGATIAIVSVYASQVRPIELTEIAQTRLINAQYRLMAVAIDSPP